MKIKKIFLLLLFSAAMVSAQNLTLDESIKIGLENSKVSEIYKYKIRASKARSKQIWSRHFPKLKFNTSYVRLSDVPPFEFTTPFSPLPIKIQDAILNNYGLNAGFTVPLFTGFRISSLSKSTKYSTKALKLEHELEINNEALRIHEAYWNYFKAIKTRNVIEASLSSIKEHYNKTKLFVKNGLATKNDLLKLEVELNKLNSKLIDVTNNVKLANTLFNRALGLKLTLTTNIEMETIFTEINKYNLDELIEEALKERKDLTSAGMKEKALKNMVESAKSDWWPQLSAFGNYYYNRPNQRIIPLEDKFADTWDLGIVLTWNVFDWGNTSAKVTESRQNLLEMKKRRQILIESVETEIIKNYLAFNSACEKINSGKNAVESAEENYRVASEKYNQQMLTSTELIDAEILLQQAKLDLIITKINSVLEETRLLKSAGRRIY